MYMCIAFIMYTQKLFDSIAFHALLAACVFRTTKMDNVCNTRI